jgi:hypothetical protein
MPRQLLSSILPAEHIYPRFGIGPIANRPALAATIGACITGWSYVEAEMAVALGALLGTGGKAAMSVFQVLQRASAQRDAVAAAARACVARRDVELVTAILDGQTAVEAERNALAHGHFGVADEIPDGVLWMSGNDFVVQRLELLEADGGFDQEQYARFTECTFVYRQDDLDTILADINDIGRTWFDFTVYHQTPRVAPARRELLYGQLCSRPQVAQALMAVRQRHTPSATPQSAAQS